MSSAPTGQQTDHLPTGVGPWVRRVRTTNFRGHARADLQLEPGFNLLIGPGDSGKSTMLTAIEYALWPLYALSVTDNDFHMGQLDQSIVIEVWVVDPPMSLRTDSKYLGYLLGFLAGKTLPDPSTDPHDATALHLRLTIGRDLEPVWEVIKDGLEPRTIRATDRATLGMRRVGGALPQDLRWGRGSSLSRQTGNMSEALLSVRDAARTARASSSDSLAESLREPTTAITQSAHRLRAIPQSDELRAAEDLDGLTKGLSNIALHSHNGTPVARSGVGTQRTVAIAAQLGVSETPALLLLDDLEHGLAPQRVQGLIHSLRHEIRDGHAGQVLATTHSPRAIRELPAQAIVLTRRDCSGQVGFQRLTEKHQGTVRAAPEGFLAPRVVVCEGATEVGLVRALVSILEEAETPSYVIAEPVDAGGRSNLVNRANTFADLGFPVACVFDMDTSPDHLDSLNAETAQFPAEDGKATEHQVFADVSGAGMVALVELARQLTSITEEALREKLKSRAVDTTEIDHLINGQWSEDPTSVLRQALGDTAHKDSWFKNIASGERLIKCAYPHLREGSTMLGNLHGLERWMAG